MSRDILFVNVQIFDGSGRYFPAKCGFATSELDAVVEFNRTLERSDCEVVDGLGATLMPGLVESHAHLSFPSSVGRIVREMHLQPEEHLLITAHNAKKLLDAGFTSAYSAGSLGARFEIALKKEIEGGFSARPSSRCFFG